MAKGGAKPGKAGGKDGKKSKHDHPTTPPGPPQPPLIITNEKLIHKNWWPVIGLVVENSPVETLLVDLMVDCVEGNSVIAIKKDDLLQETKTLLKTHLKPYSPDEGLSRRELDKRAKLLEQQKERERLEKEREDRLAEGAGGKPNKMSKTIGNLKKQATDLAQGQPLPSVPPPPSLPTTRPRTRTLADDLFDELQYFNPGKPLEETLKTPTIQTLVLLIKFKLLQLKRYDRQIFDSVRSAREPFGDPNKPPDPQAQPVVPRKDSKIQPPGKNAKGKDAKGAAAAATKDAKPHAAGATGSLAKPVKPAGGAAAGKGKALVEEDSTDPPQLGDVEVIVEPAYMEGLEELPDKKRSRYRDITQIPDVIARLRGKQAGAGTCSGEAVSSRESLPLNEKMKELMGDVTAGRVTVAGADKIGVLDKQEEVAAEMERMRVLLLASIVGTDGLPPLNHALTTKLGTYGLPAFPTSRNQMVRYVILQGFTDGTILDEMTRQQAAITCLFKIQFLRQRCATPLHLRNLLWVRRPAEQTDTLHRFWSTVDRVVYAISPSAVSSELCPLAMQIKFDLTEHTTRREFQAIAKETSAQLASLFFQVVKAKTLFQFYNSSLALQPVPRFRRHTHMEKIHKPTMRDVFDFVADLTERGPRLRLASFVEVDTQFRDDDVPVVQLNVMPVVVQNFVRNLELELYQRGVLPCLTARQMIMTPLVDSRHKLRQTPRAAEQTDTLLGYLGLNLRDLPTSTSSGKESEQVLLRKALNNRKVRYTYNRQWIQQLFHIISDTIRENPVEFVKEAQHVNKLAAAMSAWRTSTKVKKHPQPQEEVHEFQIPQYPSNLDGKFEIPYLPDSRVEPLAGMQNYFAVIKYTTKQLLNQISIAEDHFFHHTIRYDPASGKIFLLFYALHEKNTHAFVRRAITRLHSRADFPTFVCNIMENVQAWADENLNRAYRCPRRTQISPQFPYGCQGQFAYQQNCTALLSSPSVDHFEGFIRRYSLKNLVRNNKDMFARRCNWKGRRKSMAAVTTVKTVPESTIPAAPDTVPMGPVPPKSSKKKPAFISNRAQNPLPPRCTVASTHKMTTAYSLFNVLTKIIRHEERIYCRNCVVSVDTSESYNEKTAVHITASMTDGMEIFLSHDEHGRSLGLELANQTRLRLEKGPNGLRFSFLDSKKVQMKLDSDGMIFCEMVVPISHERALIQAEKPLVLSYTRSGHLHRMQPDGRVETICPNGTTLKYVFKIPEPEPGPAPIIDPPPPEPTPNPGSKSGGSSQKPTSTGKSTGTAGSSKHQPPAEPVDPPPPPPPPPPPVPVLTLEEEVKPDPNLPQPKLSRYHIESPTAAVHITRIGLQKRIQRLPDGFLRRVQVSPDLRITTRKVTDSPTVLGEDILIEQPGLPRVGISTTTRLNYLSMSDGVLLVTGEKMECLLVAGINAILVTPDGLLVAGQFKVFADLLGVKGLAGLRGFATPEFLTAAQQLLINAQKTITWQQTDGLLKFALNGDILASVQDTSGLHHDILQNGEAVCQIWEDSADRSVLPNPRVFVIDPVSHTGSEYVFAEEALNLKYKIIHCHAPDRILVASADQQAGMFACRVSDEPFTDWQYAEAEVLPARLLSDLKGSTNYQPSDGPAPRDRRFRVDNLSSAEQMERWKSVTFVAEKPR